MMAKRLNKKNLLIIGGVVVLVAIIVIVLVALNTCSSNSKVIEEPALEVEEPKAPEPVVLVYPFTGQSAPSEAAVTNRPLSVKIENSPEARPQLGISSADVVYETITEGGISRFNCIFQSNIPAEVGPVRSGRNSDVTIVPQYDALFFMSGANDLVLSQIAAAGLVNMYHSGADGIYYRTEDKEAPHNLYLHLGMAYDTAKNLGIPVVTNPPVRLEFTEAKSILAKTDDAASKNAGSGGADSNAAKSDDSSSTKVPQSAGNATSITVPFSDAYSPNWAYNPDNKTYARTLDGATIDAATGQQVSVTNLVVMWADYLPVPGGDTKELNMNAGGNASVFFDGKRFDGSYSSDGKNPPRFKDANGVEIKLSPGKSWFSVQANGADIVVQ